MHDTATDFRLNKMHLSKLLLHVHETNGKDIDKKQLGGGKSNNSDYDLVKTELK